MKLLIMHLFSTSSYFLLLIPQFSPQHPQFTQVTDAKDQASHSIREELLKLHDGVCGLAKQKAASLLCNE